MKILNWIKDEFKGLKKIELYFILFLFSIIIINAIIQKDAPIAVISAICGITYTFFAGKGKVICYLFGLCGSFCYSYLSFDNAIWGNLLLYLCYYIPMQIFGIFQWNKNLKSNSHDIIKTSLNMKEKIITYFITILGSLLTIYILHKFNDSSPIFDGITTVFSIVGMYLTVKRCIEQWIIWMIVNLFSSIMWIKLVLNGENAYSTAIMWGTYFILSFFFYYKWKKEIQSQA